MRSATDTVRHVIRIHPDAKWDNVSLIKKCWALQEHDGNTELFDPASLLRIRARVTKGDKNVDQN